MLSKFDCTPADTKHMLAYHISTTTAQRFRRWSNIEQMFWDVIVRFFILNVAMKRNVQVCAPGIKTLRIIAQEC